MKYLKYADSQDIHNKNSELVSVFFLEQISNKSLRCLSDEIKKEHMSLFDSAEMNGISKPVIILVNTNNKTMRLETGEELIQEAIRRGYTHLPVISYAFDGERPINKDNDGDYHDASRIINFSKIKKSESHLMFSIRDCIQLRSFPIVL